MRALNLEENALNAASTERRVALQERRRVSEMSVEEMRLALLTSLVTGLPNRRAFDEAGPVRYCHVRHGRAEGIE